MPNLTHRYEHKIVYVGDMRDSPVFSLQREGYKIELIQTLDHAVAYIASNPVDIVILDQELFIEVDGWSPAQSLKLMRPNVCVIVLSTATPFGMMMPKGVDAFVHRRDVHGLVATVARFAQSSRPFIERRA